EQATEEARAELEKLIHDYPDVLSFQQLLGEVHSSIWFIFTKNKKPLAATEGLLQRAVEIGKCLAADPSDAEAQNRLARWQTHLGDVLHQRGSLAEAEPAYREAIKIRARLTTEHSENPQYNSSLGVTLNQLAMMLRDRGELPEAEQMLKRAITVQQVAV